MIVLNCVFPVFCLILFGALIKRAGFIDDHFIKTSDRLIYFIFFPVMLFWKIGGAESELDPSLWWATLSALFTVYILSTLFIVLFRVAHVKAGSFSQSCYRFNTYVGMAIILNALGSEGVRYFGILIGLLIPVINLLAVGTLIWFGAGDEAPGKRLTLALKALVTNPLMIACIAGILYSKLRVPFPTFLDNTFGLLSVITLPMALISIGGSLTFSGLAEHWGLSLVSCLFKLLLFPAAGYFFLTFFAVTGTPFKVCLIFFALPTSTAIYVLSSQLGSDTNLALSAIVVSTLLSVIPLSAVLLLP